MSKSALKDRLAIIMVKPPPKIQYQQNLAETLFAAGYNESQLLEDDISMINRWDSDHDVEGKVACLFGLCQACSETLMIRMIQSVQDELQAQGFETTDMRQKLAKFLMIRQGCNRLALIHILEESLARVALEQLVKTGYYTI